MLLWHPARTIDTVSRTVVCQYAFVRKRMVEMVRLRLRLLFHLAALAMLHQVNSALDNLQHQQQHRMSKPGKAGAALLCTQAAATSYPKHYLGTTPTDLRISPMNYEGNEHTYIFNWRLSVAGILRHVPAASYSMPTHCHLAAHLQADMLLHGK
jgi:hypothetical protein